MPRCFIQERTKMPRRRKARPPIRLPGLRPIQRNARMPLPRRVPRTEDLLSVDSFSPGPGALVPDGGMPLPDFNPAAPSLGNLPWAGGGPDMGVDDSWAGARGVPTGHPFLPNFGGGTLFPMPLPPVGGRVETPFNPLAGPTRPVRRPRRFPTRAMRRY